MVQVGGPGSKEHPAATHKVLYTYKSLVDCFSHAGFIVEVLEFCDETGVVHYRHWNEIDGRIGRSLRFDTRNSPEKIGMVSIIIDAKKEITIKKWPLDSVHSVNLYVKQVSAG